MLNGYLMHGFRTSFAFPFVGTTDELWAKVSKDPVFREVKKRPRDAAGLRKWLLDNLEELQQTWKITAALDVDEIWHLYWNSDIMPSHFPLNPSKQKDEDADEFVAALAAGLRSVIEGQK